MTFYKRKSTLVFPAGALGNGWTSMQACNFFWRSNVVLVKGCENVGKVGLEDVYRLHMNDIFRYLYKLTGGKEQAEDLTQETFFRAFQSLDSYSGERVRPWLFKVAYHAFVDWQRKQKRYGFFPFDEGIERPDSETDRPEHALLEKEAWGMFETLLDRLPDKQKQAFLLYYRHSFSYAEISQVLGITVADVKISLYRGRRHMRKMWGELDHDR